VALGLYVWDLGLSKYDYCRLSVLEDGARQVDFTRYWGVLQEKFEQFVQEYVKAGGDLRELDLWPWTKQEVADAASRTA
jgi:hypothetical protein